MIAVPEPQPNPASDGEPEIVTLEETRGNMLSKSSGNLGAPIQFPNVGKLAFSLRPSRYLNILVRSTGVTAIEYRCEQPEDEVKYIEEFPSWKELLNKLHDYWESYMWVTISNHKGE